MEEKEGMGSRDVGRTTTNVLSSVHTVLRKSSVRPGESLVGEEVMPEFRSQRRVHVCQAARGHVGST